ncbi:SUKH-4 family immunity protein [Streptomyces sp. XM4193]|uniref:SUKH-4 family immunity protein n=1 Tax=Streptomyces sp. XM4193 TaxID=2929782 RepID=UPI001FF8BBC9|nr:SUKH-4 family immunity protein [Streptomyces sp. XM4193]MCK1797042.1 SUKH-4 family immunity protein [Streptomyces sp. XM4193]
MGITYEDLLEVFNEDDIVRSDQIEGAETVAPSVLHTLENVGVPTPPSPWFEYVEDIGSSETVLEIDEPIRQAQGITSSALLCIAEIPYDAIALDPADGKVYCVPDGGSIYQLNTSLENYVHFLLVLHRHALPRETDGEWDLDTEDPEAARQQIQRLWREVDPAALGVRESAWYRILLDFVDPEAHHHSDAVTYPYPFFEEDLIRAHGGENG